MITNKPLKNTVLALLFAVLTGNVHGAITGLSDAPLVTSSTTDVLPNVMFVLDDSGSMGWDYMPDTANDFSGQYGYKSNQCNGVYYEPTITYKSPITSTGAALNATITSFTSAYTNGYSTGAGTANLNNSYYYQYAGAQTTAALKKYYDTASTFYTECITSPGTIAGNGSNVFTKVSLSSAAAATTATIVVGGSNSTSVSSIKVNSTQEIMSGTSTANATSGTVATNIAAQINLCTSAKAGNCTTSGGHGYTATASGSVITITGLAATASTLTITKSNAGTMTFDATIFPIADTTKLQNFANWYSYYRTRMLMMKTAAGLAFAPIDNKYRVAFMTINDNVSPDIVDFAPFDATQKNSWYTKLYAASASNSTPLREALSNVGRMYAHKLPSNTLNGLVVNDPMQYSCQQNFTILSTDGFWNGSTTYNLAGGTVGQQDGTEPRPYNDGATQLQTTVQVQQSSTQVFQSTSQMLKRSVQIQSSTSNLQQQTSQLQTRTSRLQSQTSQLQAGTSTLQGTLSKELMRCADNTTNCGTAPATGVAGVGSSTASWTVVTSGTCTKAANVQCATVSGLSSTGSVATTCNTGATISSTNYTLTITITGVGSLTQISSIKINGTQILTGTTAASNTNNGVAAAIQAVASKNGFSSTVSSNVVTVTKNGTITASSTVGTFTVSAGAATHAESVSPSDYTLANADSNGKIYSSCAYAAPVTTGVASCTAVAQSGTPNNTSVVTARTCNTVVTAAYANSNTCTANATPDGSGFTTQCQYTTPTAWAGTPACTAVSQDATNPYDMTASGGVVTECQTVVTSPYANALSCTVNAVPDGSGNTTQCQYTAFTAYANASSCVAAAQSGGSPFSGPAVQCQTLYNGSTADCAVGTVNSGGVCYIGATSCAASGPTGGLTVTCPASNPITTGPTAVASCTAVAAGAGNNYLQTTCSAATIVSGMPTVGVASCTPGIGAGPTFITTSCNTVTVGPTGTSACIAAAASAANNYTTTSCASGTGGVADTLADVAEYYYITDLRTDALGNCTGAIVSPATTGNTLCTAGASPAYATATIAVSGSSSTSVSSITVGGITITTGGTSASSTSSTVASRIAAKINTNGFSAVASGSSITITGPYSASARTPIITQSGSMTLTPTVFSGYAEVLDALNNVPSTGLDAASHQHMTTFTLGLGARGRMVYSPTYLTDISGDFFSVKNGSTANGTTVCSWQPSGVCNWPIPGSDQIENIDDLWHAAVNGRGNYFSATDPSSLSTSLSSALAGVSARTGASAAATTSNPNVTSGDNFVFSSTFTTTSWDGELVRQQLDLTTGVTSSTVDWTAQSLLNTKAALTAKAGSRTIYTFSSGAADHLQFFNETNFGSNSNFNTPHISTSPDGLTQLLCASAAICAPQTWQASHVYALGNQFVNGTSLYQVTAAYTSGATFGATDTTNSSVVGRSGDNLVNFLRGDRSNEGAETDNTKFYRNRANILGDIVNAEAVYVKGSLFQYTDAGYSDGITSFVATNASRQGIVYAASNDGMLHAFYAADGSGVVGGDEAWAYIPSMMLPDLYKLADKEYATKHRYFVDGTPVVGDICPTAPTTACTTGANWKTILVGGFNKGGRGYYALDITTPASPKALWEFTDTNLGYTYGNPKIAKLKDGTWVVLVTTGYNNVPGTPDASYGGDGVGRLYVLNAATGAIIRTISTGVGSTSTPSGLARIAVRVTNATTDNTALAVYGGDLLGNLWRFDVNNDIGAAGYDAQLLTTLVGPAGIVQPITAKPELGDVYGNKIVYVGTGRYLGSGDMGDTSKQSIYAIKDPLAIGTVASTAIYANPRSLAAFKNQTPISTTCPANSPTTICTVGQTVRTSPNLNVNLVTDSGWFMDLPDTGERANTDPSLELGTLGFTTNVPNTNACTVGGYSYRYFMDYRTGGSVSTSTTAVVGSKLGNALATRPVYVRLPNGVVVELTRLSTGVTSTSQVPIGAGGTATRRTSWRELFEE